LGRGSIFSFVMVGLGWVSQLVGWVGVDQRKWSDGHLLGFLDRCHLFDIP